MVSEQLYVLLLSSVCHLTRFKSPSRPGKFSYCLSVLSTWKTDSPDPPVESDADSLSFQLLFFPKLLSYSSYFTSSSVVFKENERKLYKSVFVPRFSLSFTVQVGPSTASPKPVLPADTPSCSFSVELRLTQ